MDDISPDYAINDAPVGVSVYGTGFADGATVEFLYRDTFGATDDPLGFSFDCNNVSFEDSTQIDCGVPPGQFPGYYDILVTNPDSEFGLLTEYFAVIDPIFGEGALTLVSPDPGAELGFSMDVILNIGGMGRTGSSVRLPSDISPDTIFLSIVGAPEANGGQGAVYVYGLDMMSGGLPQVCAMQGESVGDHFGFSVAAATWIDEPLIAIGAPDADFNGTDSGSVYLYTLDEFGCAAMSDPLDRIDGAAGDKLGWSIAGVYPGMIDLGGQIMVRTPSTGPSPSFPVLAMGAPWADGTNGTDSGKVYLYGDDGIGSGLFLEYTFEGENAGDQFGYTVQRIGDIDDDEFLDIYIGAAGYDGAAGTDCGKAYIYSGDNILPHYELFNQEGDTAYASFGACTVGNTNSCVAAANLDGDNFADFIIGSPLENQALVFQTTNGDPPTPTLVGTLFESDTENYGASVMGIDGGFMVGDPGFDSPITGNPDVGVGFFYADTLNPMFPILGYQSDGLFPGVGFYFDLGTEFIVTTSPGATVDEAPDSGAIIMFGMGGLDK